MNHAVASRALARPGPRLGLSSLVLAVAAILSTLVVPSLSWSASSVRDIVGGDRHSGLSAADGVIPDGASVFDDSTPAVSRLAPRLLDALRHAARDATRDGVEIRVNSGWRSSAYQERLLDEAVAEYGSRSEAARWVATPRTSAHVAGRAVDVGPSSAASWLAANGDRYGLCQTYRNEPWHYELRAGTVERGCPAPYADPTRDPRMSATSPDDLTSREGR